MKKLLLVLLVFLMQFMMAEKVKLVGLPNVRVEPSSRAAKTNVVFDVLDTYGAYHKVKILSGKQSGVEGFIPTKYLDLDNEIISDQWVTLRAKATFKSKDLGTVEPGAKIVVVKKIIDWYKIKYGWVYKSAVILLK